MELVSGMMDGSLSYELEHRREPIVSGARVEREGNLELTDVPLFEGCSERQLRRIGGIARVFEAPTGTVITRVASPATSSTSSSTERSASTCQWESQWSCGPESSSAK